MEEVRGLEGDEGDLRRPLGLFTEETTQLDPEGCSRHSLQTWNHEGLLDVMMTIKAGKSKDGQYI